MKRTKIGSTTIDTTLNYLSLDRPVWQMRQSEVVVLSYLDVLQEQATFTTIDSEIQRIYNEMDKYYCIAKIIENLGNNESYLVNSFYIFNEVLEAGEFDKRYKDLIERNNAVNTLVVNIINDSINYNLTNDTTIINSNLWDWWQTNIIDKNFYTDPNTGEKQGNKPEAYPVTIAGEYDYIAQFKKSAVCFTYSAVSNDIVEVSKVAALKRKKQIEARRALNLCNVQLDSSVQANYIASGIMQTTGGLTPVQLVNKIKRSKPKIGELTAAMATVISSAISALVTLVGTIIAVRQNKLNSEAQSTLETSGQYAPADSDFLNIDLDGDGENDFKKILLVGAIGLAVYYFF